jgi:threonine aldolase
MTDAELKQSCRHHLPGHRQPLPAELFAAMGDWCQARDVTHDVYGSGALIQDFEQKVARLLGFDAAVFCITGTMTQATALRIACMERGSKLVALHPTSHILKHERGNHRCSITSTRCKSATRIVRGRWGNCRAYPTSWAPSRWNCLRGNRRPVPDWDELSAIKDYCREQGVHLHMDGARLWETAAAYARPVNEIAAGFDSVYVSLYKGIGGMAGAMLAGSADFVAKAQEWFRRQGGMCISARPMLSRPRCSSMHVWRRCRTTSNARSGCMTCCGTIRCWRRIRPGRMRICCTSTCR